MSSIRRSISSLRSVEIDTAIDVHPLPGDVAGLLGGQVDSCRGDVFGAPAPAGGRGRADRTVELALALGADGSGRGAGDDEAGRGRVSGDPVGPEPACRGLAEPDHARLAGCVVGGADDAAALLAGHAAEPDDAPP